MRSKKLLTFHSAPRSQDPKVADLGLFGLADPHQPQASRLAAIIDPAFEREPLGHRSSHPIG
jgi:hypothetical protein